MTAKKVINTMTILEDVLSSLVNSRYNNYFIVKGGIALYSAVSKYPTKNTARATTDIDLHWKTKQSWEDLVSDIERILNSNTKLGLTYIVTKRRGFAKNPTGDSIRISVSSKDTKKKAIKIDMNIGSIEPDVEEYVTMKNNIRFIGYSTYTMLSDKLVVASGRKIFRRVKDLYDIYLLSNMKDYKIGKVIKIMTTKHNFKLKGLNKVCILDNANLGDLEHAYSTLTTGGNKPEFSEVYSRVINFVSPIYGAFVGKEYKGLVWNHRLGVWNK